jgi:hypothetical protein
MPASLTTAAALLKEIYEPGLTEQLNTEVVGLRRIERSAKGVVHDVGGRYVRFGVRVRRNQGLGYRQELETLPTGGQQGYAVAQVGLKYGYGRLRLSGQVMELAESNEQAFINVMSEEVDGLKSDTLKDCNRIFYGDASGVLSTVTANATANTLTANNAQYLEVGQVIDVVSTAGAVRGATRNIVSITPGTFPAAAVVYDGADITTDITGDLIVRTGSGPVSATVFREPNGLKSIVTSTGALYNIDPAVEPVWAAVVDQNSGVNRPVSETLMIANVHAARRYGGTTSVIFANLGVMRSYFNLLTAQRRFTNTKEFAGGFEGLAFSAGKGDIPVVEDLDAPLNTMYGIDEKSITVYRDKDWHFPQPDGTMWKWVHDVDAWETLLRQYWEIGVHKRNSNFVIRDLTES